MDSERCGFERGLSEKKGCSKHATTIGYLLKYGIF